MTTAAVAIELTQVEQLKMEKDRISKLCRKVARKLSVTDKHTDKYLELLANYTFLTDYRSELVSDIQLAIREARFGY